MIMLFPTAGPYLHVLGLLLLFRLLNAISVRTFFQPDEYFQALEPAWKLAFGSDSGAWITWEWHYQLRSSLHPALFAVAYRIADGLMDLVGWRGPIKASVLVTVPALVQSVFAALTDLFTCLLAVRIYGRCSKLCLSVLSPWHWYCSTRTFSNSLETCLTIAALNYWPWHLLAHVADAEHEADTSLSPSLSPKPSHGRISLVLAAIAVLLRPTNVLIWLVLASSLALSALSRRQVQATLLLLGDMVLCGTAVLILSLISDRVYFGFWTFPPYTWLYFNISHSLALVYGEMAWHYYLLQGIPLLTMAFLPLALLGLYAACLPPTTGLGSVMLRTLALVVLTMLGLLSMVSHKEVRFIYPLLPILHVLAAPQAERVLALPPRRRKLALVSILTLNMLVAGYLTHFHQAAHVSVTTFLRHAFERQHPDALSLSSTRYLTEPVTEPVAETLFALFLTPCHTTPWRSHLVYPALRARALTCDPPLETAPGSRERAAYRDEQDRFYADPPGFLRREIWPLDVAAVLPRYLVGFEVMEPVLTAYFDTGPGRHMGVTLTRVWHTWNGLFNEDARRRGRLVVWQTGSENPSLR